jgi:hypothetical protein
MTIQEDILKLISSIKMEAAKLKSDLESKELYENERKEFEDTINNIENEFSDLKNNIEGRVGYNNLNNDEIMAFWQKAFEFKKDQLFNLEKRISSRVAINEYHDKYIGKKVDPRDPKGFLDEQLENKDENDPTKGPKNGAENKWYASNQIIFASALGAIFVGLLVSAGVCASTNYCGVESKPLVDANGNPVFNNGKLVAQMVPKNIPLDILQSQFMMALVSAVIAPVVVSVVKQKFDIQIDQSQVEMITSDAVKAVKLYQDEANKLRDENGKIPPAYQSKLRDLAFDSIRTNYDPKKYEQVISRVGVQVFDRAIEEAVKRNWIERFPIDDKQVENIIKQSIDAIPQIVEWKNLDESVKNSFLDGHIRRLLANVGLEGWGITQLNEIFDAEVNKRLAAAAIADAEGLARVLDKPIAGNNNNKYLKYTSTVALAAGESLLKTSHIEA